MTRLPEIPAQKLSILKTQKRGLESTLYHYHPSPKDIPASLKVYRHSFSLSLFFPHV